MTYRARCEGRRWRRLQRIVFGRQGKRRRPVPPDHWEMRFFTVVDMLTAAPLFFHIERYDDPTRHAGQRVEP